jgi:hypothetical protein
MNMLPALDEFQHKMNLDGWFIFDAVVDAGLVERMRQDILSSWERCSRIMKANDVFSDAELTVHHLIGQEQSFLDCLSVMSDLEPYIESYFGGKFILNSFGGAINTPGKTSYAQRVHRDIRTYSADLPLMLNTLVMLDDFTADNGATYLLSGSHKQAEKPDDEEFQRSAVQAIAPSGSILMFNSNVWHAGGNNVSADVRRSVTPMFCKPFVKPQFDYPRAIGYGRRDELSPFLAQVLGYNARIPATLEEWYQPPAKRMYRSDQG